MRQQGDAVVTASLIVLLCAIHSRQPLAGLRYTEEWTLSGGQNDILPLMSTVPYNSKYGGSSKYQDSSTRTPYPGPPLHRKGNGKRQVVSRRSVPSTVHTATAAVPS